MGATGNPTKLKLNKELIKQIARVVEIGGVTMKCALAAMNISPTRYYFWLSLAREAEKARARGEKITRRQMLYLKLLREVEMAKDRCFVRNMNMIAQAAPKDWKAALQHAKIVRPELINDHSDDKWRRAVADFARAARQAITQNTTPEQAQKILEAIESLAENKPKTDQIEGL